MTARELEALVLRTTDVLTNLDAVNASMTRQQYEELENISQKIGFVCNYPNKFPYLNKLYGELAVFLSMVEPTRYGYTYDVYRKNSRQQKCEEFPWAAGGTW